MQLYSILLDQTILKTMISLSHLMTLIKTMFLYTFINMSIHNLYITRSLFSGSQCIFSAQPSTLRDLREMSGVSQRNISISAAGWECRGAETDKSNTPQSLWDKREWELMSLLLPFLQILSLYNVCVFFVRPNSCCLVKISNDWGGHWLTSKQSQIICFNAML